MAEPTEQPVAIEIRDRFTRWFYEDTFDIVTAEPLIAFMEDGQRFEVIGVSFTYAWSARWRLATVELTGVICNGDGTYGEHIERDYLDLSETDEVHAVPALLLRLAEKRATRIPRPPEA